jgi:hypothetical protein
VSLLASFLTEVYFPAHLMAFYVNTLARLYNIRDASETFPILIRSLSVSSCAFLPRATNVLGHNLAK